MSNTSEPILIEWHLAASQSEPKELTPLATLWRELLKSPVMPYDPRERRKKFPEAFDRLGGYVAAHEQLLSEKKKAEREKKKGSPSQTNPDDDDFDGDEFDLVP
jgi:hypothetical protein